ncbi:MAG TPA: CPBP family glutamic-type intramembrane protease [Polyangiaceae bacterium]
MDRSGHRGRLSPSAELKGRSPRGGLAGKPGAWGDLALTLPVFLTYQLGVVFLHVRNAADLVTAHLLELARGDRLTYFGLTAAIGVAMVAFFAVAGRGQALRAGKLLQIAVEGAVYAVVMGIGTSWVVGKMFAGRSAIGSEGPLAGVVMSLGAGFYEELAFRAVLFGLGAKLLVALLGGRRTGGRAIAITVIWAVACAAVFSGMHYVGPLGDAFDARSFAARMVLGLALTTVYAARGFAAAVWTHALYDVWVLVV